MKKNNIPFARKKRQFNYLLKQLKKRSYVEKELHEMKQKVLHLYRELSFVFNARFLRKAIAASFIAAGLSYSTANAQVAFTFAVQNPFSIAPSTGIASPTFADLDNDGDLDLLTGEYDGILHYRENTGTATAPIFAAPIANPFGLSATYYLALPTLGDIDNDGDFDLLVGEYYGNLQFFENTGTATAPSFAAPVMNPFGLTAGNYIAAPKFVDLDDDGDLDLIVGTYYGETLYFENTGTAATPAFAASQSNPFGIDLAVGYFSMPALGDIDNDGDFDLMAGNYDSGDLLFQNNSGTAAAPAFDNRVVNPFGLLPIGELNLPELVDLDNDGDLDVFVGLNDVNGTFEFYEHVQNTAPVTQDNSITINEDTPYTFSATDFPYMDADMDPLAILVFTDDPIQGTIELDGAPLSALDPILATDIGDLVYTPNANGNGVNFDNVNFITTDGLSLSNASDLIINVRPVNDAPESIDTSITAIENMPYNFAEANFPYSDIEMDALESIEMVSLPMNGVLALNGIAVTTNQSIPLAEIPNLTYTPDADQFGVNFDAFDFAVSDGMDLGSPKVMNINVDMANAISSLEELGGLKVYPNPVVDFLEIENDKFINELQITNEIGELIVQFKDIEGNLKIELNTLPSGVYLLNVKLDGKVGSTKFIKQ